MKTPTFVINGDYLHIKKNYPFIKKKTSLHQLRKNSNLKYQYLKKTTQFLELIETPVTEYKKSTLTLCIGLGASIISCRGGEGEYSQE